MSRLAMLHRVLARTRSVGACIAGLLGVLTAAAAPACAATASARYTYDLVGRVTTALYDNGVCIVYAYDPNGNRTAQTNTTSGAPATPTWGAGAWGCAPWTPSMGGMARRGAHPVHKTSTAARRGHP